jgi:Na+/proline symporter
MCNGSNNPSSVLFDCACGGTVTRNYFFLPEFACASSFFGGEPSLGLYVGYLVVIGLGLGFALLCLAITMYDYKVLKTKDTSEHFISAGRSIKLGLTATDIVSKWTWAATLLQSANVAYRYGISGPFWYAAGASVQVMLFSMLAVAVKRHAPTAHTLLEIVQARWGTVAHLVFMFFACVTNLLVSAMLVLGGSAVVNALTGMNTDVASLLIPPSVVLYTLAGGLKATFVASYLHTVIIMVALCIFMFFVYARPAEIGTPESVWRRLEFVSVVDPVPGNKAGSLVTMWSSGGLMFGVINIVGNFGAVFVDQAYWQSAIGAQHLAACVLQQYACYT